MNPPQRPVQQSPFLRRLPLEIRILIYEFALISAEPLDLWPQVCYSNDDNELKEAGRNAQECYRIRRQDSLRFIRKELATGLLGTCCQIYDEAADYFWSKNHWRFSGRSGWQGLLRFFLTIGRRPRSRIRKIDVHAPIYMRWPTGNIKTSGGYLDGRSKNQPKMHMAKIEAEGHLDSQAKQAVCGIIQQDGTLEEMNFVVPDSFRNGDEDNFGGYDIDHAGKYIALHCIQRLVFVKMSVVFEENSYLAVEDGVEAILRRGWGLVCMPGSFIYERSKDGSYKKTEVLETRRWGPQDLPALLDELVVEDMNKMSTVRKG